MKKSNLPQSFIYAVALLISLSFIPAQLIAQGKGTFKDTRDGREYNWTKVGTQAWMTENLKFVVPAGSWAYNNDSANEVNFGRLYSWKAAQTACPKGWHLPSDKEWNALIQSLGGSTGAGLKMQSMDTIGKSHAAAATPATGAASTLLSGVRRPDGSCSGLNLWGGCWSSGKINDTVATNVLFAHGSKDMGVSSNDKNSGFSVRCVRNK
jgi:uncharacterized protein (TIGR02145 family)